MKSLRTKILTGLIFLSFVSLLISVISIILLNNLSTEADKIIRDNYQSVNYTVFMIEELDEINELLVQENIYNHKEPSDLLKKQFDDFEALFSKQKNNITEKGERQHVDNISNYFSGLKTSALRHKNDSYSQTRINQLYESIKKELLSIYKLNMQAILKKNSKARSASEYAVQLMLVTAVSGFLITLIFTFYFPGYIINPIKKLTEKIKAVSDRSYDVKIDTTGEDEIGELLQAFNEMTTKLGEYENQHVDSLRLEKIRIETLITNMNEGIILLGPDKEILLINPSARSVLNIGKQDVINLKITEIGNFSQKAKKLSDLIFSDEIASKKYQYEDAENSKFYEIDLILLEKTNPLNNTRIIKGLILILKDITWFRQRDLDKTNLLAMASHELKTPVSSINLSVKLLKDMRIGDLNQKQSELINSIQDQNKRLLRVINEILDYSQAETGKIVMNTDSIEADKIIELATFALMMLISEKEIDLNVTVPDNFPLIKADLEKTVWVLVNILNNAIRYTPQKGKIWISVEAANGFAKFLVQDSGPGIEESERELIFQKYTKDKKGLFKGTGLGLAIAKEFVTAQGGNIWVENKTGGQGSEFVFTIPLF